MASSHASEQALEQPLARASNRGCLPFSESEYLQLLDWTGRQLRKNKRGAIPADLAPILERLVTTPESWFRLVSSFRLLFRQAAGRTASLQRVAIRRGQMWMQGLRHSQEVFGAGSAPASNAP